MNDNIDYSKVAASLSQTMGQKLADAYFESEQWKQLAVAAMAERDTLRRELDELAAATGENEEDK